MTDESVAAKAASDLRDAFAVFADVARAGLSAEDLAVVLQASEMVRRQLGGLDNSLLSQVSEQIVLGGLPARNPADYLVALVRISPYDAAGRARAAVDCGPKHALTGELLSPTFPLVAAAQDAGVIGVDHARIIRTALATLPAQVAAEHGAAAEAELVRRAEQFPPPMLERIAHRLILTLDPDGTRPSEAQQRRRRCLSRRTNGDGSSDWRLHATPELSALADAVLGALSGPKAGEDDSPDPRSGGQRQHDALVDVFNRVLSSDSLPQTGGLPVTVNITVAAQHWEAAHTLDQAGDESAATTGVVAVTEYGQDLGPGVLRQLAEQAAIRVIAMGRDGSPLDVGYAHRLCTPTLRRAVNIRDRGCIFPNCTTPAPWCEVHHIVGWANRDALRQYERYRRREQKHRNEHQGPGGTHLDNLALLCPYHHRVFEHWGWVLIMRDGHPCWIPPKTRDPHQTPIRNTAHHPDLSFAYPPGTSAGTDPPGTDPPMPGADPPGR